VLPSNPWIRNPSLPSALAAGTALFLLAYFTLLSPSSLEDDFNDVRVVHPKDLLKFLKSEGEPILARGIPEQTTPSYSLRYFDFFSTTENKPQLKFTARKSNFYQTEQLIHARDAIVTLSDQTRIFCREFVYHPKKNEAEFYGNVTTEFNNGLVSRTDYMKVMTRPNLRVSIPVSQAVSGTKTDAHGSLSFNSFGLVYQNTDSREIELLRNVTLTIRGDRTTQIQSDRAKMKFEKNHLDFFMDESRQFERQFVKVHQESLEIRSRRAEVDFRNSRIDVLSALGDVSIRDQGFYSTSGKARFFDRTNLIELSEFPQVYQNSDTITGDVIIHNRNDDTIEVKQSNAIYKR
jgi:lipopolysaccharide export system protein LptA